MHRNNHQFQQTSPQRTQIKCEGRLTDQPDDCVLSPTLYNMYSEALVELEVDILVIGEHINKLCYVAHQPKRSSVITGPPQNYHRNIWPRSVYLNIRETKFIVQTHNDTTLRISGLEFEMLVHIFHDQTHSMLT